MEQKFNVTGGERKKLVATIAEWLGYGQKYLGAPTFAYEIGAVRVDKDGTATLPDSLAEDTVEALIEHLYEEGFTAESNAPDEMRLCISMPRSSFPGDTLANLESILKAKGELIKKALGITEVTVLKGEDKIDFPWFTGQRTPEEIQAYDKFICALCEMARTQKRVTAKEKAVDNEKYAFRCFLLRLGFIGAEYKEARKILLSKLDGSSAFKTAKEVSDHE